MARPITPRWSMKSAGSWRIESSRRPRVVIVLCWPGWPASGRWCEWVEGTGAYGAALSRYLRREGVEVVMADAVRLADCLPSVEVTAR